MSFETMVWLGPLLLTLQLMAWSACFAAVVGLALAFCLSFTPGRRWWGRSVRGYCRCSLIVCLATPMILHAAAWEATAGKFGWLTFSQTAARTYTGFAGAYGGLFACVWIHGLIGSAMVALSVWYGTSRLDQALADQCRLDGGAIATWWKIRLPVASGWLAIGILGTVLLAATEMTVVDLYGVRTIADEFYLFHAAAPSFGSIMVFLVLPAALVITSVCVAVLARKRVLRSVLLERNTSRVFDESIGGGAERLCGLSAALIVTLMIAFPIAGLILKTGQSITVSPTDGADARSQWAFSYAIDTLARAPSEFADEYFWTLLIAMCAAAVCVPIGWIAASLGSTRAKLRGVLDFTSLLLFLIPGPIVGLAVVRFFTLPIPGFSELYQQTLVPTVTALAARSIPIAYWILRTGYSGIDASLIDVARLDVAWARRMVLVDGPLLVRPLVIAGVAVAVVSGGDVPAMLPVVPPEVVTVGTRLFALLHSGARNQEAALAFWYVVIIVAIAILVSTRWKPADR